MRIIAGSVKGRSLVAPDGQTTRPTSSRVREAVFNSLFSLGGVEGLDVVDLFAGTGAYGLEALSRGARHATFIERDRAALDALRENIEVLGFEDEATVVTGDAQRWIERRSTATSVDLAFCDPPYDFEAWAELLDALQAPLCVVESRREVEVPAAWRVLRTRKYASTLVTLLERFDAPDATSTFVQSPDSAVGEHTSSN